MSRHRQILEETFIKPRQIQYSLSLSRALYTGFVNALGIILLRDSFFSTSFLSRSLLVYQSYTSRMCCMLSCKVLRYSVAATSRKQFVIAFGDMDENFCLQSCWKQSMCSQLIYCRALHSPTLQWFFALFGH